MGEKPNNPDTLLTLPVVLGVIVVVGGIAALFVSGLFVYRAHAVSVETRRIQAKLEAEREQEALEEQQRQELAAQQTWAESAIDTSVPEARLLTSQKPVELEPIGTGQWDLRPGVRLRAQRPVHWDQAEIIDILEGEKIKVRWLSGEPGEAVIAAELVRADDPPTQ
jgi:hypothetical protein